jgi:hypothetical protein
MPAFKELGKGKTVFTPGTWLWCCLGQWWYSLLRAAYLIGAGILVYFPAVLYRHSLLPQDGA